MHNIRYSASFWYDVRDALSDRAEEHGGAVYQRLYDKMDQAPGQKRGKGWSYLVKLDDDECQALRGEAHYRWEFNGTDAYGADKDYTRADAAKRVWQQCCKAVGEGK